MPKVFHFFLAELWQRHRGQFQIYVTVWTKQGLAPVVQKGMNTLACFCFCTHRLFLTSMLQLCFPNLFFTLKGSSCFSRPLFAGRATSPLCCWVAKIHSSLSDLPQIGCFVSASSCFVSSIPAGVEPAYCGRVWQKRLQTSRDWWPTNNLLSSNATSNPNHDKASDANSDDDEDQRRLRLIFEGVRTWAKFLSGSLDVRLFGWYWSITVNSFNAKPKILIYQGNKIFEISTDMNGI